MDYLRIPLLLEFCLGFGLAGLLWPEKLVAVFDILMFPWPANSRMVRNHSLAALAVAVVLLGVLLTTKLVP